MRHNWLVYLPFLLAVEWVLAAQTMPEPDAALQALLDAGNCPRLLLPSECAQLRKLFAQAPSGEREAILTVYRSLMREREAACRCDLNARVDTPSH